MLRLIVLCALAAVCAAKYEHCCSAADRHTVQKQWNDLWHDIQSNKIKIGFGRRAILALVEKHPELKENYKAVDIDHPEGGLFSAYSLRLLLAFDNVILLLDDPEALDVALDHMANRWSKQKGVTAEHFKTFGQILNQGFHVVADEYDPMAWKACFTGIFRRVASKLNTGAEVGHH